MVTSLDIMHHVLLTFFAFFTLQRPFAFSLFMAEVRVAGDCSTWEDGVRVLSTSRWTWLSFALAVALLIPAVSLGQAPKPAIPKAKSTATPEKLPEQPSGTHEMTAEDVGAFLDGVMPLQLQREDIAGAVVLVVKDGKVLFAKGYGYSDVKDKKPVSPDATLFRPGSVSKLFTWTALMQLVEQGKVNLDSDVNQYIDFKIPPRDGKPITVRNLMTHTPGLEETIQQLFIGDSKNLVSLGDYLKAHLPNRVYAPGTLPAYSNYGATLAGYIVQRVSGQPFDDYVEQHIFQPLKMEHTTFRQPLPPALQPLMSSGYQVGSQPARPFEVVQAWPAGSSSATAADMAHFMIAHLQNGQYEGTQILRPDTAQMMHSRQFGLLPDLNGMDLGFYQENRNGHSIIGHGGDTQYFHSDLHLILDANVGFFVSYNSAGKGEISPRTAVFHAFLDRYFPYNQSNPPAAATAKQDSAQVAGRYISDRRGDDTLFNALTAMGQTTVQADPDGTITASDVKDFNGKPKKFEEIKPLLYQEVGGQDRLGFFRDDTGRLVMAIGDYPFMAFQKARWYQSSGFLGFVVFGALVLFVLTLLLWPITAMMRRHYGQHLQFEGAERSVRRGARIISILFLVFLGGFVLFFTMATKDISMMSPQYNGWLRLIQVVGWLGVAATVIAIVNLMRSWTVPGRWLWSRIGDALIVVFAIGFAWFIICWHMLAFSLRY